MNVGKVRGHLARQKSADVAIEIGNGDGTGRLVLPLVAQAFRPANSPRCNPEGLRYEDYERKTRGGGSHRSTRAPSNSTTTTVAIGS